MVLKDIPSDGIALATGKSSHDSGKVSGYIYKITGLCTGRAVKAISCACFAHHHDGRIFFIFVCKITYHSTCKGAYASLNKYVSRPHTGFFHLMICFQNQSAISLHDPGRNLFITVPGSILDNDPVRGFGGFSSCHPYTVIIVYFFNSNFCAFFCNIVKTGLGCTFRHPHNGLLSKAMSCPCNATSVVAICSSKESGLSEFFTKFFRRENIIRQLADIFPKFFCNVTAHCIGSAQHFKSIQPETVGFVLAENIVYAQKTGQGRKLLQGCYRILGKAFMEFIGFCYVFPGHKIQVGIRRLGHLVHSPFQSFCHMKQPPFMFF